MAGGGRGRTGGKPPKRAAAPPGEDALIARYFRPMAGPGGLGLVDDAACIAAPAGRDLVLTADAVVAGVHFLPDDPADAIGWKALAVNLSDLAAKGAAPLGFLLTLALPEGWTPAWLRAFCRGLAACATAGGCPLLGGDTVRTPGPLTLSVTALGSVPAGTMAPRTGARPGDTVFVSGTIGDAALGLLVSTRPELPALSRLGPRHRAYLRDRYLRPRPRGALADAVRTCASGAMDVSDGLVGDLRKMLAASGAGGTLELSAMPLSHAAAACAAADDALLVLAATGGDDYELLCTVPPERVPAFRTAAAAAGVPVCAVGRVTDGEGLRVTRGGVAVEVRRGSYSHF